MEKTQKEIESFYDEFVEKQKNTNINDRHRSIQSILIEKGVNINSNVLEIGCGIGTFTTLLIDVVKNGKVVSMDISGESIKYAKENIKQDNLTFIHGDAANYNFENFQFDAIVMPDVLEHIPITLHEQLFKSLSSILTKNGIILIHIPNPYYLEWCHQNRPDLLQVIDQPITTDILVKNTYPLGLYIDELKTYSIWVKDCDYQYIVLRKNGFQDFTAYNIQEITFFEKLKNKIKSWINLF